MTETTLLAGIPRAALRRPSAVCLIGAVQRLLEALGEAVGRTSCSPSRCWAVLPVALRLLLRRGRHHPRNPRAYPRRVRLRKRLSDRRSGWRTRRRQPAKIRASMSGGAACDRLRRHGQRADGLPDSSARKDGCMCAPASRPEGGEADKPSLISSPTGMKNAQACCLPARKPAERLTGEAAYARLRTGQPCSAATICP